MAKTHYETLGVAPDASPDDVKRAYRLLARQLHPDRTAGDAKKAERFKRVNVAYDVLSDPKRRADYDLSLSSGGPDKPSIVDPDLFGDGLFRIFVTDDLGRVISRLRTEPVTVQNLPELAQEFISAARGVVDAAPRIVAGLREPQNLVDIFSSLFPPRR